MKNPKRKVSIVGLCDSVMHMVRTLCREYLAQTASDRELLCGEWVRPGGRVILRVRKEGGRYLLDECWSNTVNSRIQVFTFRLLRDVKFTVIRGNISEIKTLASGAGTTKGVDADVADKVTEANLDSAVAFAKAFAAQTGAVIAITGAIDIVADAEKAYCIRNGNAMMSSITGTGCQLSALTAAFVTANPGHPLEAAAAAVCAMGLAGETAHKRLTPLDGNSTYRNYIIDAIYNMTPDQLEEGANYEVR